MSSRSNSRALRKRRRRTVRGRTKAEVRDKLRGLRDDIAVGVNTPAAYSVQQAVDDWLGSGLDGRSAATVTKYRHVLKPVLELIGRAPLRELTAHDVRRALTALGKDRSTATVAVAHNAPTRAIRHAEARDLVRRNVAALTDSPKGQEGRPSKALSLDQAQALPTEAADLDRHRLGAYVSTCFQTGIRTEEARRPHLEACQSRWHAGREAAEHHGLAVGAPARRHQDADVSANAGASESDGGDSSRAPRAAAAGAGHGWCGVAGSRPCVLHENRNAPRRRQHPAPVPRRHGPRGPWYSVDAAVAVRANRSRACTACLRPMKTWASRKGRHGGKQSCVSVLSGGDRPVAGGPRQAGLAHPAQHRCRGLVDLRSQHADGNRV